jgi:hypothetical protein
MRRGKRMSERRQRPLVARHSKAKKEDKRKKTNEGGTRAKPFKKRKEKGRKYTSKAPRKGEKRKKTDRKKLGM